MKLSGVIQKLSAYKRLKLKGTESGVKQQF